MKTRHNIAVGDIMAEQIKINVGSALTELSEPPPNYAVHGRDLMSGIPKEIIVTYKEIAGVMCLSPKTVENYRESLFEKVNAKTRIGLVLYAIKEKIVIL